VDQWTDRAFLLTMFVLVTLLIFTVHASSDVERVVIFFAAFTMLAAFTALVPSRQDRHARRDAEAARSRIEESLRRIEELLERANDLAKEGAASAVPPRRRARRAFLLGMMLGRLSK
jgi:hypothetical protein